MPPLRQREPKPALTAGPARRGTVLLIDDERALIRVLSRVVGRVHNVVTALSSVYGATTGATQGAAWQVPQQILTARIVKLGILYTF